MKKYCKYLFLLIVTVFFAGCSKADTFSKAEKIYRTKNYEKFVEYVEKEGYFPVKDDEKNGATPLLLAISNKNISDVSLFLEKGASCLEKDNNNNDAFIYALNTSNIEIVNLVINNLPVSYWNKADSEGNVPITKAIMNCNDFGTIQKILNLMDDISVKNNNGKTILMTASQYFTDVRLVKYLLDKAINVNERNNNEWNAAMYAARYNPNPYILENLLIRGSEKNPNSVNLTLTMLASCNVNTGVLLTLLKYVDEISCQTQRGTNALMYACQNNASTSTIQLLLDRGIDINQKDNDGKTALMFALENYKTTEEPFLLISAGAEVLDNDLAGKTVLSYLNTNTILSNTDLRKIIDLKQKKITDFDETSL